jgi:hypothetical protein
MPTALEQSLAAEPVPLHPHHFGSRLLLETLVVVREHVCFQLPWFCAGSHTIATAPSLHLPAALPSYPCASYTLPGGYSLSRPETEALLRRFCAGRLDTPSLRRLAGPAGTSADKLEILFTQDCRVRGVRWAQLGRGCMWVGGQAEVQQETRMRPARGGGAIDPASPIPPPQTSTRSLQFGVSVSAS